MSELAHRYFYYSGVILYLHVIKPDSSKLMSTKQWLNKHGLSARKLTIVDALAPTFIPHKTKYIPILDKHVESKVFDEVRLIRCAWCRNNFAEN